MAELVPLDRLVVGPDDILVVRVGRETSREEVARFAEELSEHFGGALKDRVLLVAAEQIAVIRKDETAQVDGAQPGA